MCVECWIIFLHAELIPFSCLVTLGCGGVSSENGSYFEVADASSGQCNARICKTNDNICQVSMLNFCHIEGHFLKYHFLESPNMSKHFQNLKSTSGSAHSLLSLNVRKILIWLTYFTHCFGLIGISHYKTH